MMHGYNGEGTIPQVGFKESFWQYVERVYGRRSLTLFFGQGAILTLFSSFPTLAGCLLRGYLYRLILGGMGRKCFIEKNVRFLNPGKIFFGDRVFVGEGAFFDVGLQADGIRIGDDSHIARNAVIRTQGGKVTIGRKVNLSTFSFLYGYGDIEIGDYCLIAQYVEFIGGNHHYDDLGRPMRFQGRSPSKIIVGEDCWLGSHAVILGGVTIGKGAIIGSGAVVNRDVPEYAVAVGVPARVVKRRGQG